MDHLDHPAVRAAQEAFEQHRATCEECRAAPTMRHACDEARRLHDEAVKAAQDAYREAHDG